MQRILSSQITHIILLLILLFVAVVMSFSDARWRQQIQNFTFDNYNILKPRVASDRIAIIDIDEASLAEIGQMPWPRTTMGQLVLNLKEMGAKVIVFDIVFAEPDRISPEAIAEKLIDLDGFDDVLPRLETLPDNDTLFGLDIGKAGNVVTGFSFTNDKTDTTPRQKGVFRGKDLEKFVPHLRGVSANLKVINKYAAGNGSFFVSTDTDGIIRRVPMLVAHAREDTSITSIYPSLSLETIRVLDEERGGRVILGDPRYAQLDPNRFGVEGIQIGQEGRFIPTNARGEFLVYFAKSNKDWYIPAYKVLDQSLPAEKVKDKIVFIGTSAVGLKDIRSTPLDTFIPGVEVHLNIVDQILQDNYLSRSIEAEGLEAVTILLAGLFIIIFAPFIGAIAQSVILFMVVSVLIYAGWYAFDQYGMLIDVAYPGLSVLALFMLSTILTYLRSEQDRRQVRDAFGLYISTDFMKELTKHPEKLKLGGEIKELTVMFSDIRGFTGISEGLEPEALIQLMNDFLTPMSDLVMQNRGTIDKYMGDAMMAFWNAPLDDAEHARHACEAALGMLDALDEINHDLAQKAEGAPIVLKAGIGINTGPCAVGNMGSRQRFAYSALGDSVNLASRLEGQTKLYDVGILLGEETQKHIPDFATLELDLITVKGKTKPVRVFALLGDENVAQDEGFQILKGKHELMIQSYRTGDFKEAQKHLKDCKKEKQSQLDTVYDLYEARLKALVKNPPGEDWNGVYVAKAK
ncbi:MAG: adenylate/guanylate cyclase domain-containing protein [Alphaproteobacteria bacterium]|nr:adenylate/guanylate cyclase domain-containing protein [Alphaproteobacteria bacterium]